MSSTGSNRPCVSLGLPVYNGSDFVAEAIACAQRQTFTDWELVICDNASTDNTVALCEAYARADCRIRVHRNPVNLGIAANYNRVFELSRGTYFKWMTHDDLFDAEFVAACVAELDRDPATALVFTAMRHQDAGGHALRDQSVNNFSIVASDPEARFTRYMDLTIATHDVYWMLYGLIRRSCLERTPLMGKFSANDQVLLADIVLQGNLVQLPQSLFARREHEGAASCRRNRTARERALLNNPQEPRWFVFPKLRLFQEYARAIDRAHLRGSARARCRRALARRMRANWKAIVIELGLSPWEALRAGRPRPIPAART